MKKLFCLLLFSNFCIAQFSKAEIIFKDGSTVKGLGYIKKNRIIFKVDENEEASEWSYDITKGLNFTSYGFYEKYEYIKFKETLAPFLMEVIEEGKINLYRSIKNKFNIGFMFSRPNNNLGDEKMNFPSQAPIELVEEYYIFRKGQKMGEKMTDIFGKIKSELFADCPTILHRIAKKEFTSNNLQELVIFYNDYCSEEDEEK